MAHTQPVVLAVVLHVHLGIPALAGFKLLALLEPINHRLVKLLVRHVQLDHIVQLDQPYLRLVLGLLIQMLELVAVRHVQQDPIVPKAL